MSENKNVIIIGAGPAGLTAAYEILKNTDFHPIVLEESEFVGGISRTANYNGKRMDLGGHRFFTKNSVGGFYFSSLLVPGSMGSGREGTAEVGDGEAPLAAVSLWTPILV